MSEEYTAGIYAHTDLEFPRDEEKWEPLFSEEACFLEEIGKNEVGHVPPNSSLPPSVKTEFNPDMFGIKSEAVKESRFKQIEFLLTPNSFRCYKWFMKTVICSGRCDGTLSRLGDSFEIEAELLRVLNPLICGSRVSFPDVTEPPDVRDFLVEDFLGEPITLTLRIKATTIEIAKVYRNNPILPTVF